MNDIYNNQGFGRPTYSGSNGGFIMKFLLNKGIAKDESSANSIMLVFSLILIAISIYVVYKSLF